MSYKQSITIKNILPLWKTAIMSEAIKIQPHNFLWLYIYRRSYQLIYFSWPTSFCPYWLTSSMWTIYFSVEIKISWWWWCGWYFPWCPLMIMRWCHHQSYCIKMEWFVVGLADCLVLAFIHPTVIELGEIFFLYQVKVVEKKSYH